MSHAIDDDAGSEIRRATSHLITPSVRDRSVRDTLEVRPKETHPQFMPSTTTRAPNAGTARRLASPLLDGTSSSKPVTYPAPFLCYSTLEDPPVLARVLGISLAVASQLERAHTFGFELRDDGAHKKAVRATLLSKVEGSVYWAQTADEEVKLSTFETSGYEIDECKIYIGIAGEEQEKIVEGWIFVAKELKKVYHQPTILDHIPTVLANTTLVNNDMNHASSPIYPAYCFSASPTFNKWVKLTAADVHALRCVNGFEGQNVYFHLNHPIRYIYLIGVVIALDFFEYFIILTIDDGSGAVIEVKIGREKSIKDQRPKGNYSNTAQVVAQQGAHTEHTEIGYNVWKDELSKMTSGIARPRHRSPTIHTTTIDHFVVKHDETYELLLSDMPIRTGSVLKLKGTPSTWRGTFQISLLRVFVVSTTAEEDRAWVDYAEFCTRVLCRPWTLTAAQVKELEAADKRRLREERERVMKDKEREERRKTRRKEWEEKVRRHEDRAERKRAKEADLLNGRSLEG